MPLSKNRSPYHLWSILIAIATFALAGGVILFEQTARERFATVDRLWNTYAEREAALGESLHQLDRSIGYGGLIHNFKNYVLRRDHKYDRRLTDDVAHARSALNRLDSLLTDPRDRQALADIRRTLDEYMANVPIVRRMVDEGKSANAIDAVVKVDDTAAIAGWKWLVDGATTRREKATAKTSASLTVANDLLNKASWYIVPLFALAAMLTIFLRRITVAQQATDRAKEWVDTMLDASPDPMLVIAENGGIMRVNSAASTFFEYSPDEMLTLVVEQLVPQDQRAEHVEHRANFFHNPSPRPMGGLETLQAVLKSGQTRLVAINLGFVTNETGQKMVIASIRDVTEREEGRIALAAAKEEAETALERLTRTQDELLHSRKLTSLGKMVAGISHEVNTPVGVTLASATHLNAITSKATVKYTTGDLSGDDLENYFADAQEACRIMEVNSRKAAELIHSFKQVAVDQAGGERRTFDLKEYLEEIILSLRPAIRKSKSAVEVDCPARIVIDSYPGALSQIVTNLIMNALTHGFDKERTGTVRIVACVEPTEGMLYLEVSDDGKGIPPETLPHIFDPFFTTKRGQGGSGLGMSLIYNLATATLGGGVNVESTFGTGTTARLRFPLTLPEKTEQRSDDAETP